MYFDFSQKSSLLLLFFAHGLLLAILVLFAALRKQEKALYWLSAFLFLCCMYIAPFMFGYAGWYGKDGYRETLFYIPFQQLFLLPPVLYTYLRILLEPSYNVRGKRLLHFLPAFCYIIYSAWIFVHDLYAPLEKDFYLDGRDKDFSPWYQVAGFCSMIAYSIASLILYKKYWLQTRQSLSYADAVQFAWIREVLWTLLALLCLRSFFFLLNPEWAEFGRKFWYYLCFSAVFCYIGFRGYLRSVEVRVLKDVLTNRRVDLSPSAARREDGLSADARDEPAGLRLDELENWQSWKQKLNQLMETEKPYQDPLLTLAGLSSQLGLPPRKLSLLINEAFEVNFNDFVNQYRTDAVVRMFEAGEHNLQTLLGIAFDCGFNSKSTFNRTFLKHKGLSPKAFLASYQKNKVPNQDLGRSEAS